MQEQSTFERIINHAQEYYRTRQEIAKLASAEKTSAVAASAMSALILFMIFFFVIVFASVALAYFISGWSGSVFTGYLAVAALYLFTGMLLYFKREKWLKGPMMNVMIRNFFNNNPHDKN